MNTSVEFENGELVIRIPEDFVYATICYDQNSSVVDPRDKEDFPYLSVMVDFDLFKEDLLSSIRSEDEIGWSLVNDLIRSAAIKAMENGADGIEYKD